MLTGGDLLGAGVYGCVWMPPLDCKPGTSVSIPTNSQLKMKKVDKLLSLKDATTEFKIAQRVHAIPFWETYFVVADTLCVPAPLNQQHEKKKELESCEIITGNDLSHLRILRMNFAGEALDTYQINVHKFNFRNFVTSALEGISLLLLHSIAHMDLHSGNALLDKEQRVHFIDWNLAIDVLNEKDLESRLYHSFTLKLTQESTDYLLMNARYKKVTGQDSGVPAEAKLIEDMLDQKPILKKHRAVLGCTKDEQRAGVYSFIRNSKSYRNGDLSAWFKAYWRMNDSWAIASMIVGVITRLSLWPDYKFPPEFSGPKSVGYKVLRHMCHTNPLERWDAIQGLAELYPNNEIIRKFCGAWLNAVREHSA